MTAVEWLQQQYNSGNGFERLLTESEFEQAKAMEKEQIENAYKNGLAGMLPEGVNKMTITRILE